MQIKVGDKFLCKKGFNFYSYVNFIEWHYYEVVYIDDVSFYLDSGSCWFRYFIDEKYNKCVDDKYNKLKFKAHFYSLKEVRRLKLKELNGKI